MKLGILWDPANPIVPVRPVLDALRRHADIIDITFDHVTHRTMPNGHFELRPIVDRLELESVLWVEGGPLPGDLGRCECRKACWLVNPHLEPTLSTDVAPLFDIRLTTLRKMTADESFLWLPLSSSDTPPVLSRGIHLMCDDPIPPSQAVLARVLDSLGKDFSSPPFPIVICPGQNSRPHHDLLDYMASGALSIVDPESDMRDIGRPGEHFLVYPSASELISFIRSISENLKTGKHVASRGPDIVNHLHTPELRAHQLLDAIWPRSHVLGGQNYRPSISVLTCCYKYLKRFRHYLESIAVQNLPPGSIEVVVADPESPDGLADYLPDFAAKHSQLRVVHLPINPIYHRNRGVCINRAFDASTGQTIVSTDGDIIFPPNLIAILADISRANPGCILGVRRSFLDREMTDRILAGQTDPVQDFALLANSRGDGEADAYEGVLGYCQVVGREAFARARYPEEFDMVNQSDIVFLERLKAYAGVLPKFLKEQAVLHLWHPRNWEGTEELL